MACRIIFSHWARVNDPKGENRTMKPCAYETKTKTTIVGLQNRNERNLVLRCWLQLEEHEGDEESDEESEMRRA